MFPRISAAAVVDVVEFCACDRPCVKVIPKIDIASVCAAGNRDGCGIWGSLAKVRLLDFPNLVSSWRQVGEDVVALRVCDGGRFVKIWLVVVVEVEVDLPVGNGNFSGIGEAVGVKIVVFGAADAADLEVPDVDVADIYLAGGSEFGHGVAGAQ